MFRVTMAGSKQQSTQQPQRKSLRPFPLPPGRLQPPTPLRKPRSCSISSRKEESRQPSNAAALIQVWPAPPPTCFGKTEETSHGKRPTRLRPRKAVASASSGAAHCSPMTKRSRRPASKMDHADLLRPGRPKAATPKGGCREQEEVRLKNPLPAAARHEFRL